MNQYLVSEFKQGVRLLEAAVKLFEGIKGDGMFDTKVLKYFVTLIDSKSFSLAARKLYISTQGLQSATKRFEQQLELPIFEQHSGGVWPTQYGEILYDYAVKMVQDADTCMSEMKSLERKNSGNIVLGVSTGLLNAIKRVDIQSINGQSSLGTQVAVAQPKSDGDCESGLFSGAFDFALLNNPIDHSEFNSIPLHEDFMFVWMSESDQLASADQISLEDIRGKKLVCLTPADYTTSRANFEKLQSYTDVVLADEMLEVLETSMNEHMYGLTVRSHIHTFTHEGYMAVPLIDVRWGFGLAYKLDRVLSKYDKEFIEHMKSLSSFYV